MQDSIDLGSDEGFVKIKIGEVEIVVDPSAELDAMNALPRLPEQKEGAQFTQLIVDFLTPKLGKAPSHWMAYAYYQAIVKCQEDVRLFFDARLKSLSILASTPEAKSAAGEASHDENGLVMPPISQP